MTRFTPVAQLDLGSRLRELVQVPRSRLAVRMAVPNAIGYAIPLVVGLAVGHVAAGTTASAGALIVGFANLGGSYRVRGLTLLAATVAVGVSALVGGLAGPVTVATVVLMAVWGFAAGLAVALGTRVAFVGLLSVWALLLAGDLNLHGANVLHEAALITVGGAVQTVVAIAAWPLRPFAAERRAVASAYRALAGYARTPGIAELTGTAAALAQAAETVGAGPAESAQRGQLRTLTEQGEWIRLELVALARSEAAGVGETLAAAARALDTIAAGGDPAAALAGLELSARRIADPAPRERAASLSAWITAAVRGSRRGALGPAPRLHPLRLLRAELTPDSAAFRHAARLAVALIVAGIVYRGLSLGLGYWVPLTVLFVLKPDYGTTMSRGLGRAAGTMAGVIIAWVIVTLFTPSGAAIVVLLALLAGAVYALFPANYALSSVVLTVLIALLAEFGGGSPVGVLYHRIVDTAVGTAIALAAITLWPTREAPRTAESVADYITAESRWVDAILGAYADGDRQAMRSAQLAGRRVRMQATDAVRRALAEPRHRRPDERPLRAVLAAMDEISECALALAAAVNDGARAPAETVAPCRDQVRGSFDRLSAALPRGAGQQALPGGAGQDQALTVIATETATVLGALEQLERRAVSA